MLSQSHGVRHPPGAGPDLPVPDQQAVGGEPGGRVPDEAVAQFVERMAMALADRGFPRMPARVLTALMSTDQDALSAGEIGEMLGVSPAAVSGAVRFLTQLGLVVREPAPGQRRDRYRVPDDTWYQASVAKNNSLTRIAELADEGAVLVGGNATRAGRRLAEMGEFFRFVHTETAELVRRWRDSRDHTTTPTSAAGVAAR